jgi:hypothetical protein
MMADYCWMLQREVPKGLHKRKSTKHSFGSKKLRFRKKSVHAVTVQSFHVVFILFSPLLLIFFILLINYTIFYCFLLLCIYDEYHYALYVFQHNFLATLYKFLT